ncbi:MAG: hypothetical protein ACXWUX_09340 [Allosphingosinicella sp.]
MLRDFGSALILAAVTGALYALGMYLGPLHWNLGDDARDLLVLVGLMLSATGFFVEFLASRLSRRLHQGMRVMDNRSRRLDDIARERANRLNAHASAPVGCETATVGSEGASGSMTNVIPFPDRLTQGSARRRFHPASAM